jgi:hypothetical protein
MTAHDFENLLQVCYGFISILCYLFCIQCAIPAFEGLLPEPYNESILELLFVMAHWHGLAKLRMHNDLTLQVMDAATVTLGEKLRDFCQNTCTAFATKELRREFNARVRRETTGSTSNRRHTTTNAQTQDTEESCTGNQILTNTESTPLPLSGQQQSVVESNEIVANAEGKRKGPGRRYKTLNINTYKFHSFGDYVAAIRQYGTTDSYSTEPVCTSVISQFQTIDRLLSGRIGTPVVQGQIYSY